MKRTLLLLLAAAGLVSCNTNGPSGPTVATTPTGGSEAFNDQDFAWSQASGGDSIDGQLGYTAGGGKFTCQGGDVVLTPMTPWSRRRMIILYGSDSKAAVTADDVRAHAAQAPAGDYARYARKVTCDAASHFSFSGLPDGSWYVITLATPVAGGQKVAVMHRVETRGGAKHVTLN
ncbi:MAG: hypothetical protein ACHP7N_01210 [Caulobacterales bacterium]